MEAPKVRHLRKQISLNLSQFNIFLSGPPNCTKLAFETPENPFNLKLLVPLTISGARSSSNYPASQSQISSWPFSPAARLVRLNHSLLSPLNWSRSGPYSCFHMLMHLLYTHLTCHIHVVCKIRQAHMRAPLTSYVRSSRPKAFSAFTLGWSLPSGGTCGGMVVSSAQFTKSGQ
jgi:hypothetical protein